MADTVKVPAIGPVRKQWVWVGGALVLGIVGYAYWTRRSTPSPPTTEELADAIPQDREPPATVVGTESFGPVGQEFISTNSQWFTKAVDYMTNIAGYDLQAVNNALGKFLARQPLSTTEVNYVNVAKGAVGEPPLGGPWPVVTAPPPVASQAPVKMPTPTGLRLAENKPGRFRITWSAVPGTRYYFVQQDAPGKSSGPVSKPEKLALGVRRGATYVIRVRAHGAGRPASDWSSPIVFRAA